MASDYVTAKYMATFPADWVEPEAPDFFEPVEAWRLWAITAGGRLMSLSGRGEWEPGENVAVCAPYRTTLAGSGSPCASAPAKGCHCGWWAIDDLYVALGRAAADLGSYASAVGKIRMWGRAIRHEQGWRSSHAEIASVYMLPGRDPRGRARKLLRDVVQRRYLVRVEDLEPLGSPAASACQFHDLGCGHARRRRARILFEDECITYACDECFRAWRASGPAPDIEIPIYPKHNMFLEQTDLPPGPFRTEARKMGVRNVRDISPEDDNYPFTLDAMRRCCLYIEDAEDTEKRNHGA